MNTLIKNLLFSFMLLLPVGVYAETCDEQNKWWPYCLDPASGPDVGSAEWMHCQARGGCDYY